LKCGVGEGWRRSFGPIPVRNEEVLHRGKEDKNILHTMKRMTVNCISHILHWKWLLKHVVAEKLEGNIGLVGGGIRRKQLLDELKEAIGHGKLKEEALDRTMWKTRFGKCHGPVVRQTTELMNEWMNERNVLNFPYIHFCTFIYIIFFIMSSILP
jgi:hypothetical protein